jgi:hypothetical protein
MFKVDTSCFLFDEKRYVNYFRSAFFILSDFLRESVFVLKNCKSFRRGDIFSLEMGHICITV